MNLQCHFRTSRTCRASRHLEIHNVSQHLDFVYFAIGSSIVAPPSPLFSKDHRHPRQIRNSAPHLQRYALIGLRRRPESVSVAANSSVSVRFSQPLRTVFLLNIRFLFCTCLRCLQSCLPIPVLATSAIAMCPNQLACTIHHQWSWASLQQNPLDVFEKEQLVDTCNPHPTTSFCLLPPP